MKTLFVTIIITAVALAKVPIGGFSTLTAYIDNVADIIDSSFIISAIAKSTDPNDKDFRLEYKDERGRMKLYRKDILVFADGHDYYIADGTHSFGSPKFRKLIRCESFSYFRRVQVPASGTYGHSKDNINESWVIIDNSDGSTLNLTDKTLKQILIRSSPLLYNEYTDRTKRNGTMLDYLNRACKSKFVP